MSASKPDTKPQRGLGWRWKMALSGAGMSLLACGLVIAPAAYFIPPGGEYNGQDNFYTIGAATAVILLSTVWMYQMGIKHEREMNQTD